MSITSIIARALEANDITPMSVTPHTIQVSINDFDRAAGLIIGAHVKLPDSEYREYNGRPAVHVRLDIPGGHTLTACGLCEGPARRTDADLLNDMLRTIEENSRRIATLHELCDEANERAAMAEQALGRLKSDVRTAINVAHPRDAAGALATLADRMERYHGGAR